MLDHLLKQFGVWKIAVMSSVSCFHTIAPSLSISLSKTGGTEAEDKSDSQPRRGIFHRDWRRRGHLQLVKIRNGSIDWLACSSWVTRPVCLWQIHQATLHTDTVGCQGLLLIYISAAVTWQAFSRVSPLKLNEFKEKMSPMISWNSCSQVRYNWQKDKIQKISFKDGVSVLFAYFYSKQICHTYSL